MEIDKAIAERLPRWVCSSELVARPWALPRVRDIGWRHYFQDRWPKKTLFSLGFVGRREAMNFSTPNSSALYVEDLTWPDGHQTQERSFSAYVSGLILGCKNRAFGKPCQRGGFDENGANREQKRHIKLYPVTPVTCLTGRAPGQKHFMFLGFRGSYINLWPLATWPGDTPLTGGVIGQKDFRLCAFSFLKKRRRTCVLTSKQLWKCKSCCGNRALLYYKLVKATFDALKWL